MARNMCKLIKKLRIFFGCYEMSDFPFPFPSKGSVKTCSSREFDEVLIHKNDFWRLACDWAHLRMKAIKICKRRPLGEGLFADEEKVYVVSDDWDCRDVADELFILSWHPECVGIFWPSLEAHAYIRWKRMLCGKVLFEWDLPFETVDCLQHFIEMIMLCIENPKLQLGDLNADEVRME